jgi:2-amino-4-hydroxy-6-hydroxymethyldihydropteridine diphosphokinase
MNHRAVIAFGSNIRPEIHIPSAILRMQRRTRILSQSAFVSTRPIGREDQPDFINGALLVETDLDRSELEKWLHVIEDELGRTRDGDAYGPRTIDLDLAVWDGEIVHPDVCGREFVENAVLEVLPELKSFLYPDLSINKRFPGKRP